MRKLVLSAAAFLLFGPLAACSSRFDFVAEVLSPKTSLETKIIEGEEFSFVRYQTGGEELGQTIYYIGGSGCTSLRAFMGTYFSGLPEGLEIVGIEKMGVQDRAIGGDCAADFWAGYTYDELLRRNDIALSHVLEQAGLSTVPIIGTSEGGAVALELAARSGAAHSLVMIGAGAMSQRQELELLFSEQATSNAFKRVAAAPLSVDQRVFGLTHRYWSSVLDRDPSQFAAQVSIPVLIIIGENDESVPVPSAQLANELIAGSELIIWPDATHTFDTPNGNQRDDVIRAATSFVIQAEP